MLINASLHDSMKIHVNRAKSSLNKVLDVLYTQEDLPLLAYYSVLNKTPHDAMLLQPEFLAERLAELMVPKHYLTAEQREEYSVGSKDGIFFDIELTPLHGKYIYGLLPDNRLYAAPASEVQNHSHLVAGLPVKAIGFAHFHKGQLISLNNNSGHYKPHPAKMLPGIKWFAKKMGNKEFLFEDHSAKNHIRVYQAKKYIQCLSHTLDPHPLTEQEAKEYLAYMVQQFELLIQETTEKNKYNGYSGLSSSDQGERSEKENNLMDLYTEKDISRYHLKKKLGAT